MIDIRMHSYKLKDLDNVYILAQTLAHYFPRPQQYVTGIYELLFNAIEHGNLSIGFDTKTKLIQQGLWKQEITRRLSLPEYAHKEVAIALTHDDDECRLRISDQGKGFAWKDFVTRTVEDRKPNGRGLMIALNSQFDSLAFNTVGNEVTCMVRYEYQPMRQLAAG